MRARDKFVHRWKADRQVGHPVILAGPAQMIGRALYSTTASTDDISLWILCQSTSDIHCYQDVKSIPWNITTSVSQAGFSNLPTPPLKKHIHCFLLILYCVDMFVSAQFFARLHYSCFALINYSLLNLMQESVPIGLFCKLMVLLNCEYRSAYKLLIRHAYTALHLF